MCKVLKVCGDIAAFDGFRADLPNETVNVFREAYSPELMGYFLRSKNGSVLIVNSSLPNIDQIETMYILTEKMNECKISESGILARGKRYFCGGSCCNSSRPARVDLRLLAGGREKEK